MLSMDGDHSFSRDTKLALALLIGHYKFEDGGKPRSLNEIAAEAVKALKAQRKGQVSTTLPIHISSEGLKAFVQRLTSVDELPLIYEFFHSIYANEQKFGTSPDYIKAAIKVAFSFTPRGLQADSGEIEGIMQRLASQHEGRIKQFNETMPDTYLFYRYAAHIDDHYRRAIEGHDHSIGTSNADNTGPRPHIVKASIKITRPLINSKFPYFELHYRPSTDVTINTAIGSVILIDGAKHMLFFGEDQRTNYPLYIMANYTPQSAGQFNALVVRLHEGGKIFASRVCFVRAKKDMTELDKEIGLFQEDDASLKDEVKDLLSMINNHVGFDGKTALVIKH